jgi:hypothetical protein
MKNLTEMMAKEIIMKIEIIWGISWINLSSAPVTQAQGPLKVFAPRSKNL